MATRKSTAGAKSPAKKKAAPAVDVEAMRKKLLADATTKGIAKNLGVTVEAYVEQVLHFVQNPDADANLYVVEDEDLRGMGLEPPDEKAIGKYVYEAGKVVAATNATEFNDARKQLVSMDDLPPVKTPEKTDEKLKDELKKQLRGKRGGKG